MKGEANAGSQTGDKKMTSNRTLADRYAAAKADLDAAEAIVKALKAEIEALGIDVAHGDDVDVVVDLRERKGSLDEKALLRLITPDELTACRGKPTVYSSLRIKAKVKG
jgi:hypothetical protein